MCVCVCVCCDYHNSRVTVVELWSSFHHGLAVFVNYWLDQLHSFSILCSSGPDNVEREILEKKAHNGNASGVVCLFDCANHTCIYYTSLT